MKALLYFMLIALVLNGSFSYPKVVCNTAKPKSACNMKHKCCASAENSNKNTENKQSTPCKVCNFCPMCLAFVMPVKPNMQRNFASVATSYAELVQGKLSDYNPFCWRPPNT
jgi:hypothetical protein